MWASSGGCARGQFTDKLGLLLMGIGVAGEHILVFSFCGAVCANVSMMCISYHLAMYHTIAVTMGSRRGGVEIG